MIGLSINLYADVSNMIGLSINLCVSVSTFPLSSYLISLAVGRLEGFLSSILDMSFLIFKFYILFSKSGEGKSYLSAGGLTPLIKL